MKENELRNHADCSLCKQKIGASGIPMFWVVKIERHGIKVDVARRQDGLAAMLGGHAMLANVMGPDEDMTMPMMDSLTLTVCETCAVGRDFPIAAMAEISEG